MASNIKTPHAAVLVWNYNDRITNPKGDFNSTGVTNLNEVDELIVSTLSCVSIQTSKSKGQPDGSFSMVLAPSKNWVSTLTAGSWCCIMMSNEQITQQDLSKANKNQVKMIGRIESVRSETSVDEEGARRTLYYVTGVDWGTIFNSILYIDNLIAAPNEPKNQGNGAAVAIRNALFGNKGSPQSFAVADNLTSIIDIMGKNIGGYKELETLVGRLSSSVYEFTIPNELIGFFNFLDKDGEPITNGATALNKLLALRTGTLTGIDKYEDKKEALGFIDPFSLQGTHSLWQILLENSNPALNEMFCDMRWPNEDDNGLQLAVYNRIRPFSYKDFSNGSSLANKFQRTGAQADESGGTGLDITSYFQLLKTHQIETNDVISVNAGTNWRDKVNFVEIKPAFSEFAVVANWYKQKAQCFDEKSFAREGFKPLIFDTKQFPSSSGGTLPNDVGIDWDQIGVWAQLLRDWYFGTHKLLNGTLTMYGTTEYIGVGNNIMFDASLVNPTPNMNSGTVKSQKNGSILAHVENISHSFGVSAEGTRTYRTTIQFVRGIIVDENGNAIGEGGLDTLQEAMGMEQNNNTKNVFGTSDSQDPSSKKRTGN